MHVFLRTERMVLRRFTKEDVDLLVELDSDPEVMRFITGGKPTPREEVEQNILPAFLDYYERSTGYGFWAAVEVATGAFLGWFHFRPREGGSPDEAELGYRLRRSAWGKGYATEGSRALIRAGFTEHGVERVVAETMVVHTASRRVMEKAGLTLVHTFHQPWPYRIEGDEHGDVEYALRKADWQRREPAAELSPPGPEVEYREHCYQREAPMKVSEILKTKGRSVETIDPGASVTEAVRRLAGPPQIGALVVCTPGDRKVTGTINERDVLRGLGKHGTRLLELTVAEVMSRRVPVCSPDDSVAYVMREMTRLRHRHLPVIEGGELAGVVSIGDVVKNRLAEIELETGVLRDAYIGRRV